MEEAELKRKIYSDDAELWKDFKSGNKWAFSCMYRKYVQTLYHYATRLTPDEGLIEDCIQDLFIGVWKNRAQLSDTDSIKYYLFRALRRKIARKTNAGLTNSTHWLSYDNLPDDHPGEATYSYEFELIQQQAAQERHIHLQKALNLLTDRQREVIFLRYYGSMSHQEISSIMSISYQSVCNLIQKALSTLKKNIIYVLIIALLLTR